LRVSFRPLVLFSGLTVGDYLLWNWSVNGNHDVIALVSGLTLPPLSVACVWLLALGIARLLARSTRRPIRRPRAGSASAQAHSPRTAAQAAALADAQAASAQAGADARRLAA
jgi:hypothetical protein